MSSDLIRKEDFSGMYVPKDKTVSKLLIVCILFSLSYNPLIPINF